jgi:uncharacterized Zn-binding protein involved in type VI secretion
MPGMPIAIATSPLDHGGLPTSFSTKCKAAGEFILRVGDLYVCDEHGETAIASGSETATDQGMPIAREGDATACGGLITVGVPTVLVG